MVVGLRFESFPEKMIRRDDHMTGGRYFSRDVVVNTRSRLQISIYQVNRCVQDQIDATSSCVTRLSQRRLYPSPLRSFREDLLIETGVHLGVDQ